MAEDFPVLIVGGGPVGLTASLLLSRQGVRSLLVERHPATAVHPKARAVNARTMEIYRQCGIEAEIRAAGLAPEHSRLVIWTRTLAGEEIERRVPWRAGPESLTVSPVRNCLIAGAQKLLVEDVTACRAIGHAGLALVPEGARILTHCNAGALATAGYGTALGVVRAAFEAGRNIRVLADETRPFLQGARLTAWELQRDGIPVTVITDNMAAHLMKTAEIDLIVVGADRIAANGDVANKIGTYGLAVLAREHGIPFYVAAPLSTVDLATPCGDAIPIEERGRAEVAEIQRRAIVPEGVPVRHPAFDITPARLVTAIVTERGVARAPYALSLSEQRGKTA